MCGIFGFISSRIERPGEFHKFATRLFIEAEGRGRDASGFAALANGTNLITDKRPYPAAFFTKISQEWRNLRKSRKIGLIGHTRAATCGDPADNNNNHPFHGPRYVMAHNGWVPSHNQIAKMHGIQLKTDCDSELILHFLESKATIKDGISAVFNHLDDVAAMAVCVLDKATGDIHLFRNPNSPCVLLRFKRWNSFVFASTPRLIIDAAVGIVDKWGNIADHAEMVFGGEIPAYADVCIKPNGKIETSHLFEKLQIVQYQRRNQYPASWDDMADSVFSTGSVFSDMSKETINRLRSIAMADAKDTTGTSNLEETSVDMWSCAVCSKPFHQTPTKNAHPDPQNRSELQKYLCENCYRDSVSDSQPLTDGDETSRAKRKVLNLILPTSLLNVENPLDTICEWREPVLDHELDDVDQANYMRILDIPTERKIDLWTGMDYRRVVQLDDAEFLAYTDFIRNCLVS